eukprot:TRINITY_DN12382_c0_g1_i3.p1 TRINITY_DN12382_c0_g1~~TRINITY_DN12382_c0_g1_i3.p1  ORF type:complete len:780 (+),score=151.74 TRINITY_DN12382_c0_g1_i3:2323-4662(+)
MSDPLQLLKLLPMVGHDCDEAISELQAQMSPGHEATSAACEVSPTMLSEDTNVTQHPDMATTRESPSIDIKNISPSPSMLLFNPSLSSRTDSQRSSLQLQLDAKAIQHTNARQVQAKRARANAILLGCLEVHMQAQPSNQDRRLVTSFIRTHTSLVTSMELAQLIVKLYYHWDEERSSIAARQACKRGVVALINEWCEFPEHMTDQVRVVFSKFNHQIALEGELDPVAEIIAFPDVEPLNVCAEIVTETGKVSTLAYAIACLDYEIYTNLMDDDLWRYAQDDTATAVDQGLLFSRRLSRWAAATILTPDTRQGRADVFLKWLEVAEHLLEHHIFNSAFILYDAFKHPAIASLYSTRLALPPHSKRILKMFRRLTEKDYKCYTEALYECAEAGLGCVPYMQYELRHLKASAQGMANADPMQSSFSKGWQDFQRDIDDFLHFQAKPLYCAKKVKYDVVDQIREALSINICDHWLRQFSDRTEPMMAVSFRPYVPEYRLALNEAICGSPDEHDLIDWLLQDNQHANLFDILETENIPSPKPTDKGHNLRFALVRMVELVLTQGAGVTRADLVSFFAEVHTFSTSKAMPHCARPTSTPTSGQHKCDVCHEAVTSPTMRHCQDCGCYVHAACQPFLKDDCTPLVKHGYIDKAVVAKPQVLNLAVSQGIMSGINTPCSATSMSRQVSANEAASASASPGISRHISSNRSSLADPPLSPASDHIAKPSSKRSSKRSSVASSTVIFFGTDGDHGDIRRPSASHRTARVNADGKKVLVHTKGKNILDV